jgi:hypothetical protein
MWTGGDFTFGSLFGEALLYAYPWVFGLRAVTPYSGLLFPKKGDI